MIYYRKGTKTGIDLLNSLECCARVDGGKIILAVDASWTEAWNGKVLGRNWALSGNRLTLTGDPEPFPRDPFKTAVLRQVYEKIE